MNNFSSMQEYMPWPSTLGGIALLGFVTEMIGFCIFLSFIVKKYTPEKKRSDLWRESEN